VPPQVQPGRLFKPRSGRSNGGSRASSHSEFRASHRTAQKTSKRLRIGIALHGNDCIPWARLGTPRGLGGGVGLRPLSTASQAASQFSRLASKHSEEDNTTTHRFESGHPAGDGQAACTEQANAGKPQPISLSSGRRASPSKPMSPVGRALPQRYAGRVAQLRCHPDRFGQLQTGLRLRYRYRP